MKIRTVLILVVLFAAVLFAMMKQNPAPESDQAFPTLPEVNYQAPVFELNDLMGKPFALTKGKPVLLNFWATWCPPCKAETPDLVAVSEAYGDQVTFIGVNVTTQDTMEDVRRFAADYQVSYPIVLDETGEVTKQYRVSAMPTSFVLDAQGVIVYKKVGPMTAAEMKRIIDPLLTRGGS
ncbi:TlpA family protein disulfide reductase [Brevibacillus dissolubilis]|uniref:TlpA family protein disulfide reductase n=1 Tax=Brevibacillus dissolubilis TaxID=1844116 RepID=UPI00159B8B55|nr:TlpA disulfide reductase family protein [Brevibacillus dissolubilis]